MRKGAAVGANGSTMQSAPSHRSRSTTNAFAFAKAVPRLRRRHKHQSLSGLRDMIRVATARVCHASGTHGFRKRDSQARPQRRGRATSWRDPNQHRMRRSPILAAVILSLVFAAARGEDAEWKACSNPGLSYVLKYPPTLEPMKSETPGCSFQTADGEFNVEAVAEPPTEQTEPGVESRMQKELELMGDTVTYKTSGESWFVISGVTPDGTEFYRKLFTDGRQWISLRITYPHARNEKFDPWVTRIEKNFVPFAQADVTGTE